jgi:hypothetical protein
MMIPYPSVSPNQTIIDIPAIPDTVGTAIGGAAIGAIGATSLLTLFQYLKHLKPRKSKKNDEESDDEGLVRLYVNPSDLAEIRYLLTLHRKPFAIRVKD